MKELGSIWKIGGLLADNNNDKVPDGVNVRICLKKNLIPIGLIDFCGRLGFETTALSFDFFQESSQYDWSLYFENGVETACQIDSNGNLLFTYNNEKELDTLLRYFAHYWPSEIVDVPIYKVSWEENEFFAYAIDGRRMHLSIPVTSVEKEDEYYPIQSLSDFWDGIGFTKVKEASPTKETKIGFRFIQPCTSNLLKEACYLAARIGMMSTELHFPLTGSICKDGITIEFIDSERTEEIIFLPETQILQFKGAAVILPKIVNYFSGGKHFSEGGSYLSWERQLDDRKAMKEEPMFHLRWEDKGEVKRMVELCQQQASIYQRRKDLEIEIFLSEPTEVREKVKEQVKEIFDTNHVKIRSAFKPGFCWIEEEVLPLLKQHADNIDYIMIECEKDILPGLELPIRWIQELYPIDLLLEREIGISMENIQFLLVERPLSTYCLTAYNREQQIIVREKLTVPVRESPYLENGKKVFPTTGLLRIRENNECLYEKLHKTDRERFYFYYQNEVMQLLYEEIGDIEEGQGFSKPFFDRIDVYVTMSEEERKLFLNEERMSSMEALHEDIYFNTLDYFMLKGEQTVGKGYTAPGGVHPFMKAVKAATPFAEIIAYRWQTKRKNRWVTKKIDFTKNGEVRFAYLEDINTDRSKKVALKVDNVQKKRHSEHIREWYPAVSYKGNPLQVLEVTAPMKEEFHSSIKLSIYKPTIFIEAGHHANEVSSTPAILELIQEMRMDVFKKVNIVVLPMANPDGKELHKRMTKDNPEWKHHAARYNAVGLEYRDVLYHDTEFGEADVIPAVMKKWAPDVIVDGHGIPSHEWVQPFAGYNSPPRFPVSYFIPNALIYGIGRQLNNSALHVENLTNIIKSIQQKIAGTDIQNKNHYWLNRYKKYGYNWLPDVFPLQLHDDLIFYIWNTEANASATSAVSRFPDWIAADIISEAADETVYDQSLKACIKAQKLFHAAIIDTMIQDNIYVTHRVSNKNRAILRKRPIRLNEV
ncbi:Zinc carboxypeptidase [Mycobacteroides abscessus subsp. abscessus]|nr:Zinc carboxypeptidase [Mycobacteroides abscessus subsp. abscessus]